MNYKKMLWLILALVIPDYAMQKPDIPRLKLPVREFQEQIIHLDLAHQAKFRARLSRWGFWSPSMHWPQHYERPHKNSVRMLAMIESRLRNRQDLSIPVTSIYGEDRMCRKALIGYAASSDNYFEVTKKLLDCGVDPNSICRWSGSDTARPVHCALIYNAQKTLALLLESGKINIPLHDQDSPPLFWYISVGFQHTVADQVACTKMLLKAGANPNAMAQYGLEHKMLARLYCPEVRNTIEREVLARMLVAKYEGDDPTYFNLLPKEILFLVTDLVNRGSSVRFFDV